MAHIDYDRILPRSIVDMPSSGIRKFFDILDSMTDVTALTVGQPDFVTPWKIREAGITVPIIPGIMPITNAKQMKRSIQMSGCYVPQRFKSLLDKFGSSPAAMKQAGIETVIAELQKQIDALYK